MNWKFVLTLFTLIILSLIYETFSKNTVELMTNDHRIQLKKVLKNPKLSASKKINAIEKMNIQDADVKKILAKKVADMQKVIDLMKIV